MHQVLSCSTVSLAPEVPGLYAWYGRVHIGLTDFRKDIHDGKDLGNERLREALARHTQRYSLPNMRVHIKSSFESEWGSICPELTIKGFLDILTANRSAEDVDDDTLRRTILEIDRTMASQRNRQLLKETLDEAVPLLSAPIYIGVSDNLRERLTRHVAELGKLLEAHRDDPRLRERLAVEATHRKFAVRVFAAGFNLDHLQVHVLDLEELSKRSGVHYSTADLRDVAASAEWLLNRWYRPYLGRR